MAKKPVTAAGKVKPAVKAVAKSATKPAVKSATKPAAKSATKPAVKSATKSAVKSATKSAVKPAAKSATKLAIKDIEKLKRLQAAALATPTNLSKEASKNISAAMNGILADVFAIYLKTKNFHWHVSGPHFRDYHLMLDEHGGQLFAMTDDIAERVRKVGGTSLRSIGHISRTQRVLDNDENFVEPSDMLAELCGDNKSLAASLREAHEVCNKFRDIASASMIESWIDETERRTWFLFEASRKPDSSGH